MTFPCPISLLDPPYLQFRVSSSHALLNCPACLLSRQFVTVDFINNGHDECESQIRSGNPVDVEMGHEQPHRCSSHYRGELITCIVRVIGYWESVIKRASSLSIISHNVKLVCPKSGSLKRVPSSRPFGICQTLGPMPPAFSTPCVLPASSALCV
jgi:hypothetical protein